jgi:Rieske Fe-S protein
LNITGMAAGRRSFLKLMLLGLTSAAGLMITWGVGRFALFGARHEVKREISAEFLDKLRPAVPFHVPEAGVWVLKTEANPPKIMAFDDRCTHLGCRQRWNQEKGLFECPCHGSEFDLEGHVKRGPANRPLPRFSFTLLGENKLRLLEIAPDGSGAS